MAKNYDAENRTSSKTSNKNEMKSKNEMNSRNEKNCHKGSVGNKTDNKSTNAYNTQKNDYSDRY